MHGERLFELTARGFSRPLFVSRLSSASPQDRFQELGNLVRGDFDNVDLPVHFEYASGADATDVINTGSNILFLISQHMVDVLKNNGLTGWDIFPVEIAGKNGSPIAGYHGLSICGRSGPRDYDKSEVIVKQAVANGPKWKFHKGIHLDMTGWDGSDFFLPERSLTIVVTERVKSVIKRHQLTNIKLTNLLDIDTQIENRRG